MAVHSYMVDDHFERKKNLKALGITVGICLAVLLVLLLASWSIPKVAPPLVDEGIEVNLGNSDQGLGDLPPMVPGAPSNEDVSNTPAPVSNAAAGNDADEPDESDAPDATPIASTKAKSNKNDKQNNADKKTNGTEVASTPAPPKAKAVYGGAATQGPGGNNADSYNGVRNQGIAGGTGDQGHPNGDPNSDSYVGNGGTGKSGVSIRSGLSGRRFSRFPEFNDNFNAPAKVAVDIKVDRSGNVTSAAINPRGTTTTNANIRNIALKKAKELKLNEGNVDLQLGTIVFDFKIKS